MSAGRVACPDCLGLCDMTCSCTPLASALQVDAMAEACEHKQQPRRAHTRSQSMGSLSLGGSTAQPRRLQGSGGSGPLPGVRREQALGLSASQTIRRADAEFKALLARQQGRRSSWQQAK